MLMAAHRSVVWNYRRLDGVTARVVIDREQSALRLTLFLDDKLEDTEEFSNARDAMKRAEELRLLVTHRGRSAARGN
jgi:hypothetical protein